MACGSGRYLMRELTESMSLILTATTQTLANNQGTERATHMEDPQGTPGRTNPASSIPRGEEPLGSSTRLRTRPAQEPNHLACTEARFDRPFEPIWSSESRR